MGADLERLAELRERLDRVVQVAGSAAVAPRDGEAADPSGAVHVHLGADGELATLVVSETWREHHAPGSLGAVVRDTFIAAQTARATAAAEELAARLAEPEPTTRPLVPDGSSTADRLQRILADQPSGPHAASIAMTGLEGFLTEALTALDDAAREAERRRHVEHTATVGSAVAARVDGAGHLIAVEYDERWLADASAFTISLETTEAISDARAAAAASLDEPLAGTALADVARTIDDPVLLAQRLGLSV
ncbi:hypothetical protein Bcav_3834 [Beutenbergia cavernae DSM 12333]|uniref:YbaB/EbfC DNA-binding family protein n=1 Tax=Beutenbergia cavernae (strain ATCC BAA-8 / DSM 12333 / CCUG 43141 / JCM 11478 / NBRC 16432 / NCIMB 13614 / HKI 0122) TaxID=471853 RepID=C5C4F2_BEUC1|nr:hypothetical protein [Beutenbergia cavernae]ACQ82076.1 hypothetical protein Bcav_3834 [Beutenbergia cavernae DSM 12333]